jgi:exopolysaccharide production protein ExoY
MDARQPWKAGTNTLSFPRQFSCEVKHLPLKRIFDIFFSICILILSLPLLLIIALTIKSTSVGNVIYSQERIGRGGTPFRCYKFRTMFSDADSRLHEILKNDPQKQLEWEASHKLKKDPRITRIGAFLRKTSLDELPQFWNALKGDLSVVGPRPVVKEEVFKHYGVKAYKILSIRPGITGIWQVSGRSDINYATRVAFDERYVDTRTFMMDLKLIACTIPSMILKKGAY